MAAAEQMAAEVAGQSETEGEADPTAQVENADEDQVGEPEKKKQRTWMRTSDYGIDLSGSSQTMIQFQIATSMKWNEKSISTPKNKTIRTFVFYINRVRNWWFDIKIKVNGFTKY